MKMEHSRISGKPWHLCPSTIIWKILLFFFILRINKIPWTNIKKIPSFAFTWSHGNPLFITSVKIQCLQINTKPKWMLSFKYSPSIAFHLFVGNVTFIIRQIMTQYDDAPTTEKRKAVHDSQLMWTNFYAFKLN